MSRPPIPAPTGLALLAEVDGEVERFLKSYGPDAVLASIRNEPGRLTIVLERKVTPT